MLQTVKTKTHLIIKNIHEEYDVNWCGKFMGANPLLVNGMPIFILVSAESRVEVNTWDMAEIEKVGKKMAEPHGREAITESAVRVYLKEKGSESRLMAIIKHRRVKKFAPMYDDVYYRKD